MGCPCCTFKTEIEGSMHLLGSPACKSVSLSLLPPSVWVIADSHVPSMAQKSHSLRTGSVRLHSCQVPAHAWSMYLSPGAPYSPLRMPGACSSLLEHLTRHCACLEHCLPSGTLYSPVESACQISKSEAGPWGPGSGGGRGSLGSQNVPIKESSGWQ